MKDVNINNTMLSLVIHAGTCMKEAIIAEKIAYRSNVSYVLFCNHTPEESPKKVFIV